MVDDETDAMRACDCTEGVNLQLQLINHLLSHQLIKREISEETPLQSKKCSTDFVIPQEIPHVNTPSTMEEIEVLGQCPLVAPIANEQKLCEEITISRETPPATSHFNEQNSAKELKTIKRVPLKTSDANGQGSTEEEILQKQESRGRKGARYNRRERSPNTESIQKQFTKDPFTNYFHCNFCSKRFRYKQGVERHLTKEHDPTKTFKLNDRPVYSKRVKCDQCFRMFTSEKSKSSHNCGEAVHKYPCIVCFKSFYTQKSLNIHLLSHQERNLTCDKCGENFQFRMRLRTHLLKHIGVLSVGMRQFRKYSKAKTPKKQPEKIICDQCSELVHPYRLKLHFINKHTQNKSFKCKEPECDAVFTDYRGFTDHQNIHSGLKPFVCEFCNASFAARTNLRGHRLRHIKPDRYQCQHCQHNFVSSVSLKKHVLSQHTQDPDYRPWCCEIEGCDKTFRLIEQLKEHKLRHNEPAHLELPCTQNNCSFVARSKRNLCQHMRRIHNIRKREGGNRVFPSSSQYSENETS